MAGHRSSAHHEAEAAQSFQITLWYLQSPQGFQGRDCAGMEGGQRVPQMGSADPSSAMAYGTAGFLEPTGTGENSFVPC